MAVHNNKENIYLSMRSLRSLTRSLLITTTATTRNRDDNFQDAKEATTTIDNVANKVVKRNHFKKDHNNKLQIVNKVAKRNDKNEENGIGPRATREVTMIRQETLVVVPVAEENNYFTSFLLALAFTSLVFFFNEQ